MKDQVEALLANGISRASNYLAATFTQEEDNEEILKYFKRSGRRDWKI